ncbi:MAG: hypothetical protein PSX81_06805 [bacterium]|nr:hypothetical protein [bacterium]
MKSKKTNITKSLQVNEPTAIYGEQSIVFFKSFEEEEIHVAKARAALTYEQRMTQIEVLRKQVFNDFLLPNNTWPTIAPIFKIMPPYTSETR